VDGSGGDGNAGNDAAAARGGRNGASSSHRSQGHAGAAAAGAAAGGGVVGQPAPHGDVHTITRPTRARPSVIFFLLACCQLGSGSAKAPRRRQAVGCDVCFAFIQAHNALS